MKKIDIYRFLDRVELKARNSIDNKYQEQINKEKERINKKYKNELDAFDKSIEELNRTYQDILNKVEKDGNDFELKKAYCYSSCVKGMVENLKSATVSNILYNANNIKCIGKLVDLQNKHEEEKFEVVKEYSKVRAKCKQFSTAKQCSKYLEELGFDTSSIGKIKVKTEAQDVNKSKLFVCGENK